MIQKFILKNKSYHHRSLCLLYPGLRAHLTELQQDECSNIVRMSVWRAHYTVSTMLSVHLTESISICAGIALIEVYCTLNSPFWTNENLWFYTYKITRS